MELTRTLKQSAALALSALLLTQVTACGNSQRDENRSDSAQETSLDEAREASQYGLPRPNTLEDAVYFPPIDSGMPYFEPPALGQGNVELAFHPGRVFQRDVVTFDDRQWERTAPGTYVLLNSDVDLTITYTADFRNLEFRHPQRVFPVSLSGTLQERRAAAGFLTVLGMSGADPSDDAGQVHASAVASGAVVVILEIGKTVAAVCAALIATCTASALAACGIGEVDTLELPCSLSAGGGTDSASFDFNLSCEYTCKEPPSGGGSGGGVSGGGGDGGGADDGGAGSSAGDPSAGEGGDDGGGDGDGGDDGGDGEDEPCDEEAETEFSIGSVPGDGGIDLLYVAAEDDDSGGEDIIEEGSTGDGC